MKIRITPRKLDLAADSFFEAERFHKANPRAAVTKDYIERQNLAGIALRRWAEEIRLRRNAVRAERREEKRFPGAPRIVPLHVASRCFKTT